MYAKDFNLTKVAGLYTKDYCSIRLENNTEIHETVRILGNVIIRDNVRIGENTRLGNCIIENSTIIGKNCHIKEHVNVGASCKIGNWASIDDNTTIKNYVEIGSNCNIGPMVMIKSRVQIADNIKIGYDQLIPEETIIKRQPLQICGTKHDIIAFEDKIRVGCQVHELEWWLQYGEEFAKNSHYTDTQINEYRTYFEMIKVYYENNGTRA